MKILILSIFPAPYRVEVFNELGKQSDLTVIFERDSDDNRKTEWFLKNFKFFRGYLLCNHATPNKESIRMIEKCLNNREYDLVILYDYSTKKSFQYAFTCIRKKIPYFINSDGSFITKSIIKGLIKRFFLKNAAGCLASGKMAAQYFEHYGASTDKIYTHRFTSLHEHEILREVLTLDQKQDIRRKLSLEAKMIVITASRFIKGKRIEDLINAWAYMPDDYLLLIVGSGELEDAYKALIRELNITNIAFAGFLNHGDLMQYYKAADLFVLPSEREAWGLVVNEAMACGLPVVTTTMCIAGIELIKNGVNGFTYETGDVNTLRDIIKKTLSDNDLRNQLSKNALETIRDYTYENILQSHMEAIEQYYTKIKQ